jgi:hypothetical protein
MDRKLGRSPFNELKQERPTMVLINQRRAMKAALVCGLALAASASGWAQSTSGYSVKVLTMPTGGRCSLPYAMLSPKGDVVVPCSVVVSSGAGFFLALALGDLTYMGSGRAVDRLTEFKAAGGSRTLGSATKAAGTPVGYLPNGDLLVSGGVAVSGVFPEKLWRNGISLAYAVPPALAGYARHKDSAGLNASLYAEVVAPGARPHFKVRVNGQVSDLPEPPAECGVDMTSSTQSVERGISEDGQVAWVHLTRLTNDIYTAGYNTRVCLWDKSRWLVGDELPWTQVDLNAASQPREGARSVHVNGVSNAGDVLLGFRTPTVMHLAKAWSATGWRDIDSHVHGVGVNQDWIGGATKDVVASFGGMATIWRNGVPVDINSKAVAPSNEAFRTVLASNVKGQLLVMMSATGFGADFTYNKLAVLTPK